MWVKGVTFTNEAQLNYIEDQSKFPPCQLNIETGAITNLERATAGTGRVHCMSCLF